MRTTLSQYCHTQHHHDCPGQYTKPRPGIQAGILYIDHPTRPPGENAYLTKATCICSCHHKPAITTG